MLLQLFGSDSRCNGIERDLVKAMHQQCLKNVRCDLRVVNRQSATLLLPPEIVVELFSAALLAAAVGVGGGGLAAGFMKFLGG